jgi:hypothetical protein
MKSCILFISIICASILFGCKETSSPTEIETKKSLVARSWQGDNYEIFTYHDSSRVVKDPVLEYAFNKDGSCALSQATYSVSSISGQWNINGDGKSIVITLNRPTGKVTETLPIVDVSSTRFIFGDTTSHGYSLVPKQ